VKVVSVKVVKKGENLDILGRTQICRTINVNIYLKLNNSDNNNEYKKKEKEPKVHQRV